MIRELKIYKLYFTSPLHIGSPREDYGISQTTIASDTFYAALTACLAKIDEKIPENGDLGCSISSLFPFYQKDGKDTKAVLFFPRPLLTTLPANDDSNMRKQIKKVAWLSADAFQDMLTGKDPLQQDKYEILGKYLVPKGIDFGVKNNSQKDAEKYTDFCHSQVSERVCIEDRTGQSDAVPFYMDRVFFREKSGLFFIADGNTELLDKAISMLAFEGIGTDRNVGNGFFEYSQNTIALEIPENADHVLALSSFVPESKEQLTEMLASEKSAYELQRRGGWITTHPNQSLRKNVIYILNAGSVLKHSASDISVSGRIVDLRPDVPEVKHPVWRNGKALFVPVKL